jgi:ribonuclease P protein component
VIRNRAKRRTREAVRLLLVHITPGHDLIFVIRHADVATVPFAGLQAAVEYLVRQAGLWRDISASH